MSYVGLRVQMRVSSWLKDRHGWPHATFETTVLGETEKAYHIRHPLNGDASVWVPKSHVQSTIELVDSRDMDAADLIELGGIPITRTDLPPWEHQLRAYHFAYNKHGAMLAFSMRGGKSRCTIDLLVNRGHKRVLVVAPAKIVESHVWAQEFRKWCTVPFEVVELHDGSVAKRADLAKRALARQQQTGVPLVLVTNYEASWRNPMDKVLLNSSLDCVVADECHRAKAPGGKASMFLGNLAKRVPWRIGLSGTPMGNSPLDIYGQYRFIDRNIFGANHALFKARYALYGGPGNHILIRLVNEDELNRKFYSIAFRVADEELDLPPALHITRTCQLSPAARKVYRELEDEFYTQVENGEVTVANALTKIVRLQQVTSGYLALDDGTTREIDSSKSELLEELLDELGDQPAVIFCRFKHDLDAVAAVSAKLKRTCAFMRGGVNQLAEWQAGQYDDLAVQIQSGREGVSFARAKVCIYYSTNHSLNDFQQSQKRIVLVGQKDTVAYYYLAVERSIDTKIYAALRRKEDVVTRVLARRSADESEDDL
jgi:SNF2 family DNA or RNA helicase